MGFIGVQPATVPLTASDIEADIINSTHIGDTAISGFTALAEAPADTDEFLISDGGVLKRIDASFVGGGVDGVTSASSSTAINIATNGEVTKPLNPAFRVHQNTDDDAAPNHTMYNSNITEDYDVNADMGTNGSFTAPVTGKYLFTMSIYDVNATENTNYDMCFITSNRNYRWGEYEAFRNGYTGNTNYKTEGAIIADMDANDTAYVKCCTNVTITNGGNSEHAYFSGILIG